MLSSCSGRIKGAAMGQIAGGARARPTRLGVIGAKGVGDVQGGIETFCSNFYRHLTPGRFDVTIFVCRAGRAEARIGAHRIIRIPAPRWLWLEMPLVSVLAVACAWMRGIRTLHFHGIGACIGLPLARLLGMKTVVRYMGPEYTTTKWGVLGRWMLRFCEGLVAVLADHVVCLNKHLAHQLAQATGRTRRVSIVPNGVERPPSLERPVDPVVRELVEGRPYILAVGRIVPPKNFHLLIEAFLSSSLADVATLVIAGEVDFPGPYGRRISSLASRRSNVLLPGAVFGPTLWALYRHCRLFVLPSMHEGMSFSLLEAAAAGARIVASDLPANRMICEGFARLIEVNSVDALRQAMVEEFWRPVNTGERARQRQVSERHRWRDVCAQTEPILLDPRPTASRDRASALAGAAIGSC
jgi:glycosyltransferase involved in cell wall biosynthesis